MNIRNINLAKIHVAKKQLGLDDETYRAILARLCGVKSAKDLNARQLPLVLQEFERLGWQPVKTKHGKRPNPPDNKAALMSKIEAQLSAANRSWAYADGMAMHMFKVEKVDWLGGDQLLKLVQALAIDARRHGRKT
ncbi:MAG TPA: regulatory protein GemA [Pseudomonas sp.]|uniref:gp16 family protein n=1 Tax=Pseudomonas sp. TaxID=306 RepID=UPI002BAEE1A6|nr:regulatory protein GemA [Pseudomonas sp.]HWH86334.1 regulatory protein GemA [Pseudomonas sp.]